MDEILKCDHSNESYRTELSYGAVGFSIFFKMMFERFSLVRTQVL